MCDVDGVFSMERPTLNTLLLTENELDAARTQVQQMAYFKWQNAGCPDNDPLSFWSEAELEWIEYYYVPHRNISIEPPRPSWVAKPTRGRDR
jgi:hypothetical protein